MSHFSVTVALPAATFDVHIALERLLKPFDENREVEAYEEDGETYWRNPQAKWDYWIIGGRWRGYFPIADGFAPPSPIDEAEPVDGTPELIAAEYRGPFPQFHDTVKAGYCDGGRVRALDLGRKRDEAGEKAEQHWNEYAAAIDGTPQHAPWSEFRARVELSEQGAPKQWKELVEEAYARARKDAYLATEEEAKALEYGTDDHKAYRSFVEHQMDAARKEWQASQDYPVDQARKDYHAQPRIQALRAHPEFSKWFDGPEDTFDHLTRDEYVQQQRDRAVPGYATIRADGRWMAPGRMGWFGMSDDDPDSYAYYVREANAYIDSLSQDAFLVVLDCHIRGAMSWLTPVPALMAGLRRRAPNTVGRTPSPAARSEVRDDGAP